MSLDAFRVHTKLVGARLHQIRSVLDVLQTGASLDDSLDVLLHDRRDLVHLRLQVLDLLIVLGIVVAAAGGALPLRFDLVAEGERWLVDSIRISIERTKRVFVKSP